MTEKEEKKKIESLQPWQQFVLGAMKTHGAPKRIVLLQGRLGKACFYELLAKDAEMRKAWLTMTTTTNLSASHGSVNPATNKDTKN